MSGKAPAQSDRAKSDLTKPWTIKGISWEARNAAISASDRDGMTIGAWLERAIRQTVQADRTADRAPAIVPQSDHGPDLGSDLSSIERMVALAEQMAIASGRPAPRNLSSLTYRLLRQRLKALDASPGPTEGGAKSD